MKRMKEYKKPLTETVAHSPELPLCMGTITKDNSTPNTPFFDPSMDGNEDVTVD